MGRDWRLDHWVLVVQAAGDLAGAQARDPGCRGGTGRAARAGGTDWAARRGLAGVGEASLVGA
jgi:hypothetical protein